MRAKSLRCDGCGAPLEPKKGARAVDCSYCLRRLLIEASVTHVATDASARELTDRLLAGPRGSTFGMGDRVGASTPKPAWDDATRTLWPTAARASSQYGGGWTAQALVGPPRVFPATGDRRGAWAPTTRQSDVEWVEVDFPSDAPLVDRVRIFETNATGAVFAVTVLDGVEEELLWEQPPAREPGRACVLEIVLAAPRRIRRLRAYLVNRLGATWSEIDTVGLVAVEPLPEHLRRAVPAGRGLRLVWPWAIAGLTLGVGACVATSIWASCAAPRNATPPAPSGALEEVALMTWNVQPVGLERAGVVWADRVLGYSTQFRDDRNAAAKALGPPDVFPGSGDLKDAWAPRPTDHGTEHIEVAFPGPVRASAVVIVETFNPGAVARVDDITPGREPLVLWRGRCSPHQAPHVLSVEIGDRELSAVRIVLDTARIPGWNEIDAIGLVPLTGE